MRLPRRAWGWVGAPGYSGWRANGEILAFGTSHRTSTSSPKTGSFALAHCVRHERLLLPPADDEPPTADERQHRARHRRERGDPELQPSREHPADALVAAARDVHAARPLGGARRARQPAVARARGVHRARDEETVRRAVRRQEAPPPRPRPSQRQVLCRRALRRRRRAHEERGASCRRHTSVSTTTFSSLAQPQPTSLPR